MHGDVSLFAEHVGSRTDGKSADITEEGSALLDLNLLVIDAHEAWLLQMKLVHPRNSQQVCTWSCR